MINEKNRKNTLDIVIFNHDSQKTKELIASLLQEKACADKRISLYCMDTLGDSSLENAKGLSAYYDVRDKSDAQILNFALSVTHSDFITFRMAEGTYQSGALSGILGWKKHSEIISLTPFHITSEGVRAKYCPVDCAFNSKGAANVNLSLFPQMFHTCFSAYIFSKKLFDTVSFDESLSYDSELKVLLELLDKKLSYQMSESSFEYTSPDEMDYFNYLPQFDKDWYLNSMDNFLISAVKPGATFFRQRFVMYLISNRYACNKNERDKSVLSPAEVNEFVNKTGEAIQNVDDVIISDNRLNGTVCLPKFFGLNFLRMKYKNPELMPALTTCANEITAHFNDCLMWKLSAVKIEVKVIYFDGENLTIDGFFPGNYVFKDGEIEIVAVVDKNTEYPVRTNGIYALEKVFNVSAAKSYSFQLSVPSQKLKNNMKLSFCLKYKGKYYPMGVAFNRAQTKISGFYGSYWCFDKFILTYQNKAKRFLIEDLTKKSHLIHELRFIRQIAKNTHGMWKIKMVGNRLLYWVTKPFFKNKKIWITMDKLFKAGDNGEYFYRYVKKMKPKGVKIYYVVQKDSPDYKRLKKEFNTIVRFNSVYHKMLALHTDLMLATHVDTLNCNGYYKATQKYFKDLYNARVVCLAHGLTIQKIAQYQNRVFDNTVLYFFASKYEVENVSHEIYDYYDKSALQLTGHARYDGLVSNDQKIILITPTWRRGITTGKANKGSTYAHSDSFKNSEYFKLYNGLINDERVIESAKKNGYKIVYLLHPAMSNQLEDFDKNDYVDIVAATSDISYEKILTESSLMVTDYSGVQFDFAYMKKPLVYYHPDTLPPQYEEGGLKYDTMGFGPVCTNHRTIVETLCSYMDKNCEMEQLYKDRVDDFFCYCDHNNCERIYEKVIEFQNKFDKVNEF